jgi:hypothetical protein
MSYDAVNDLLYYAADSSLRSVGFDGTRLTGSFTLLEQLDPNGGDRGRAGRARRSETRSRPGETSAPPTPGASSVLQVSRQDIRRRSRSSQRPWSVKRRER